MPKDKEKTAPFSVRLPVSQIEIIEMLEARQILGSNKSAVARTLLQQAIDRLVETGYVQKHLDMLKALGKPKA